MTSLYQIAVLLPADTLLHVNARFETTAAALHRLNPIRKGENAMQTTKNNTPARPLDRVQMKALVEADASRPRYSDQGAVYDPASDTYRQRYSNQRYRFPEAPASKP